VIRSSSIPSASPFRYRSLLAQVIAFIQFDILVTLYSSIKKLEISSNTCTKFQTASFQNALHLSLLQEKRSASMGEMEGDGEDEEATEEEMKN